MQKINLHTHTTFCDGKATAEQMVLSAIEKGFSVLGFSGHCIHPLNPDFYLPEESWHMAPNQLNEYVAEVKRLQQKYEDKIQILLGFEADYFENPVTGAAIPSKKNYAQFNPDYLIGSVHFVSLNKDFYTVDDATESLKANMERLYPDSSSENKIDGKSAVCDYFEAERQMLLKGDFDIWGHPDLVRKRNGLIKFFNEEDSWYKEQLELTAKAAAKTGVIAEINTGAIFRKAMDDLYPGAQFLALLHKYNIPVCINSDAHNPEGLDCAWDRAVLAAKNAGYSELVYPVKGKTVTIKL